MRFLLQFLGAGAEEFDSLTGAPGADSGDGYPIVALVTGEDALIQVVGQGNLTAPALEDKTAIPALNKGGGSPAVEK